jgi:DnaK suppressor protein
MTRITLPEGYIPTDKEPYMSDMQVEYFRQKLLSWKEELQNESRETLGHLQEESGNLPDFNDRAAAEIEKSFELRTRDRYRKLLDKIESALLRIENKTYGYCEETGEPIGLARLDARPVATLCIEAQERHESYEKQHAEDE